MTNKIYVAAVVLLLALTACSNRNTECNADARMELMEGLMGDISDKLTDLSNLITQAHDSPSAETELVLPMRPIYFDFSDETTHNFSTLASVEGERISLLGGRHNGVVLYYNGQHNWFDWWWLNLRGVLPTLDYFDVNADGKNDLVITMKVGTGSGICMNDLHVLTVSMDESSGRYQYTEHALLTRDVHEWMNAPMQAIVIENGHAMQFNFAGSSYVIENTRYNHSGAFTDSLYFGSIVRFYVLDDGVITVYIPVGARHEDIFVGPDYFGAISANVMFDGCVFSLNDFIFEKYDNPWW